MKAGWTKCLAVSAALMTAGSAFAQQPPHSMSGPGMPGPVMSGPPGGPPAPPALPGGQTQNLGFDPRDSDHVNGRTASWPGYGAERMSPEERRQLRRDINQHGRELYRERRGEPPG